MYLNHITTLVSPFLTSTEELGVKYNWGERNKKIFGRFHNLQSASIFHQISLPDLINELIDKFLLECPDDLSDEIDAILWAHSIHSVMPFDMMNVIKTKIKKTFHRDEIDFFSVTQASCASGLVALKLIQSKLYRKSYRCCLIITGEKCFHKTVQYVDQNGIFGEGFSATVISMKPFLMSFRIKSIIIKQLGAYGTRMHSTTREVENLYDRAFLPTMIDTIQESMVDAKCDATGIDILIPYHISPVTFERLADRLGFKRDIILKDNLFTLGHCFCSDAFINLHDLNEIQREQLNGKNILLIASGVAGTFSASIITSEIEEIT